MRFPSIALRADPPAGVHGTLRLPRRVDGFPSPVDWRDEVLYFLLVDRFSDGAEGARPLLERERVALARRMPADRPWCWSAWAESGSDRWQGGTLRGVESKLGYLKRLGVTTLWLSPVLRQRMALNSYHGYGVQDFLDVDPHFGSRADLTRLVAAAHDEGIRVILDIIINHSGCNWIYPAGTPGGQFEARYTPYQYPFGSWLDESERPADVIRARGDGVWPADLQNPSYYTRAGSGDLGAGDLDDPNAEHKRADFLSLRDFRLADPGLLTDLALCYKYWIALTDCDGFRIDTLKHVSFDDARNFCGTIKEFAANLGKENFFLVGEVAGGDYAEDRYLDVLQRNLNAALDIGEMRLAVTDVAKGLRHPGSYFDGFAAGAAGMGSHRTLGNQHVSILDDHDHVFGDKVRFSAGAASDHQVAAGAALLLYTLGIPCIYYGTEQALAGPEPAEHRWLPQWRRHDRYLREAMFGPSQPRRTGSAGLTEGAGGLDAGLPGFGPFGTAGHHCFHDGHPAYVRIAALARLRRELPVLRHGRQYARPISRDGEPFAVAGPGELVAWSRILDDDEALCVLNAHGVQQRGGAVLVDADLNPEGSAMTVMLDTAQAGGASPSAIAHPAGSRIPVQRRPDGTACVQLDGLGPSEVVVLANHPEPEDGAVA